MAKNNDSSDYTSIFDDTSMSTGSKVGLSLTMTVVLSGAGALLGGGAGIIIDETLLPADDEQRVGYEIAAPQYDRMFTLLEQKSDILEAKQLEFSSLAQIHDTPDMLRDAVGLNAEESDIYKDVHLAQSEIEQAQNALTSLSEDFALSAIVDNRLSEQNVKDLFTRFQNDIGDFESLTTLSEPDYADLDQSRAYAAAQPDKYSTDKEKAAFVSNDSNSINTGIAQDIGSGLGGSMGVLFVLLLLMQEYRDSNYRRNKSRTKKGLKH